MDDHTNTEPRPFDEPARGYNDEHEQIDEKQQSDGRAPWRAVNRRDLLRYGSALGATGFGLDRVAADHTSADKDHEIDLSAPTAIASDRNERWSFEFWIKDVREVDVRFADATIQWRNYHEPRSISSAKLELSQSPSGNDTHVTGSLPAPKDIPYITKPGNEFVVSFDIDIAGGSEREFTFRTYTFEDVQQLDLVPVAAKDVELGDQLGDGYEDPKGHELFTQLRMQAERANQYFASGLGTMGAEGRNFQFPTKDADQVEETHNIVAIEDGWLKLPFTLDNYKNVDEDHPTLGENLNPQLDTVPPNFDPGEDEYKTRYAPWIHAAQLVLLSDAIDPVVNRAGADDGTLLVATEERFSSITHPAYWTFTPDHDEYSGETYDAMIWDRVYGEAWLHEIGHDFGLPDLYATKSPYGTGIDEWGQMAHGDAYTAYSRAAHADWMDFEREAVVPGKPVRLSLDWLTSDSNLDNPEDFTQIDDTLIYVMASTIRNTYDSEFGFVGSQPQTKHFIAEARRQGDSSIRRTDLKDSRGDLLEHSPAPFDDGVMLYNAGPDPLSEHQGDAYLEDIVNRHRNRPVLKFHRDTYYDKDVLVTFEAGWDFDEPKTDVKITQSTKSGMWVTFTTSPNPEWFQGVVPDTPFGIAPPGPPLPAIDVLVETADGKKAGTDPATGERYENIDGASVTRMGLTRTVHVPAQEGLSVIMSGGRLQRALEEQGYDPDPPVVHDQKTIIDTNPTFEESDDDEEDAPFVRGRMVRTMTVPEDTTSEPVPAFADADVTIDPDRINADSDGKFITAYVGLVEGFDPADIVLESTTLNAVPAVSNEQYGFAPDPLIEERDGQEVAIIKFRRDAVVDALGTGTHDVGVSGLVDQATFLGTITVEISSPGGGNGNSG